MARLKAYHTRGVIEAGCDEAGRGCLAGPVVAAAVILPLNFNHPLLNDSKQLSELQRDKLRPIIEAEAVCWAVSAVGPREIEEINILNASILGMHKALDELNIRPENILVDGNRFKSYRDIRHNCIVKGDSLFRNIAAASILAKTHRDEIMMRLHQEYPQYNWDKNKGYPTVLHRDAIREHGACTHHRMTFTLLE